MTEAFVVDASVGFAWVYPSQSSAESDQLLKEVELAPVSLCPRCGFWRLPMGCFPLSDEKC